MSTIERTEGENLCCDEKPGIENVPREENSILENA